MPRLALASLIVLGCADSSAPEVVPEPSPLSQQCVPVTLCRGPLDPALQKMTCACPYVNKDGHCSCLGVADGCD